MKNKVTCLLFIFVLATTLLTGCKSDTYYKAVSYYNENDYEFAKEEFQKLPNDYKDTQKYLSEINDYESKYKSALHSISSGNYDKAEKALKELPEGYYQRDELLDSLDVIQYLVKKEWYSIGYNYGWEYKDYFYFDVSGLDVDFYVVEMEYSDGEYMGKYKDYIKLSSLKQGEVYVAGDDRLSFKLDLTHVDCDSYVMNNGTSSVRFFCDEQ